MTLYVSDFTMERKIYMSIMATDSRASGISLLKPNCAEKNLGAHDRISSDLAISKHEAPKGVHRLSLPELDTAARSRSARINKVFVLASDGP
jgi:hypothetical protein